MIMLAQASIESVPAEWLKYAIIFCICGAVLICTVAGAIIAWLSYRQNKSAARETQTREIAGQPIEVRKAAKRFNHELSESRHSEITRRLESHDEEFDAVWNAMSSEDKALAETILQVRQKNAERFEAIAGALGRIEGRLGTTPKES